MIFIDTPDGPKEVQEYTKSDIFAITDNGEGFAITHIPTGFALPLPLANYTEAHIVFERIEESREWFDWANVPNPNGDREAYRAYIQPVRPFIAGLRARLEAELI